MSNKNQTIRVSNETVLLLKRLGGDPVINNQISGRVSYDKIIKLLADKAGVK